ncbi:MAG: hypothetical protein ABFD14_06450 [Anaerolineaceae bacterium]
MRIESAIEHDNWLEVVIDGRRLRVGEKYTILELGYAVFLMDQNDEKWLLENGDRIPEDPSDSRAELKSGHGILITADPILVALAIESWWSRNGLPQPQGVQLPIPTFFEAVDIVRNRKILNDFNNKWAGFVPGLELFTNRRRLMNLPKTKHNPINDIESKTINFKADLTKRYWDYQKNQFPDWRDNFERPFSQDGRPPVFLVQKSWRNIIINPNASEQEKVALLQLILEGEHHKWFRSMNSSQALALSILGNLAIHNSIDCLSILMDDEGDNLFGSAIITSNSFSMEHKINYLGERRRTSLDGYISGNYRVAIECKFTETEVGTCSRPRLTPEDSNYESELCDGSYSRQRSRNERCSLTEIGVLYWKYIPALFRIENDVDLDPCPVNKNYQLIRNILAIGMNEDGSVSDKNSHALLIYDERNPAFMKGGNGFKSYAEVRAALKRPNMLRKCSWQRITHCIRENNILPWLTDQLSAKYGL